MDEKILEVISEIKQGEEDNLDAVFAKYFNKLEYDAACGPRDEDFESLYKVVEILSSMIVQKYMKEHGWSQSDKDIHKIWKHMEDELMLSGTYIDMSQCEPCMMNVFEK